MNKSLAFALTLLLSIFLSACGEDAKVDKAGNVAGKAEAPIKVKQEKRAYYKIKDYNASGKDLLCVGYKAESHYTTTWVTCDYRQYNDPTLPHITVETISLKQGEDFKYYWIPDSLDVAKEILCVGYKPSVSEGGWLSCNFEESRPGETAKAQPSEPAEPAIPSEATPGS